jgi:hypothetical protein
MITASRKFLAVGALVTATSAVSASAADVPTEYSQLVPANSYAVMYVSGLDKMMTSMQDMMPPGMFPMPSTLNELMSPLFMAEEKISDTTPIIAWVAPGANGGGGQPGEPQIFVAVKAPGSSNKNTHAAGDTTLHFSGDMIISAQGNGTPWSMPAKSDAKLIKTLPTSPVAVAVDMNAIWTDHGPQLQMLGGFAGMAAQMALMEQTQDPNMTATQKKMVKDSQRMVGQTTRKVMSSVFDMIRATDTMTMALNMNGEMLEFDTDVNFRAGFDLGNGADMELVKKLPGGMLSYFVANQKMTKMGANMDIGAMDMMLGSTPMSDPMKESFDSMGADYLKLIDGVTGGVSAAVSITPWGIAKEAHIEMKDPQAFIAGIGKMWDSTNALDFGMNFSKKGSGSWLMTLDADKIASELGNVQASKMISMLNGKGHMVDLKSDGNIVNATVLPVGEKMTSGKDMSIRNLLMVDEGDRLVAGLAVDMRLLMLGMVTEASMSNLGDKYDSDMKEMKKMLNAMPAIPFSMIGSENGSTFSFDISLDIEQMVNLGMQGFSMMSSDLN